MDNFGQTRMGQEFYEGTMKSINKNLARIADALEGIAKNQTESNNLAEKNSETLSEIKEILNYRLIR